LLDPLPAATDRSLAAAEHVGDHRQRLALQAQFHQVPIMRLEPIEHRMEPVDPFVLSLL